MITKVGSKILGMHMMGTDTYVYQSGVLKNINGVTNAQYYYGNNAFKNFYVTLSENTSGSSAGIIALLGVGDTAATADDYRLDNMLVNGIDVNTIVQCSGARANPSITTKGISYLYQFTNTGSSAVTIKEICICYRVNGSDIYMLARRVIPARTIQPDETVTFDYEINWF